MRSMLLDHQIHSLKKYSQRKKKRKKKLETINILMPVLEDQKKKKLLQESRLTSCITGKVQH